jgi:hypothetical protein
MDGADMNNANVRNDLKKQMRQRRHRISCVSALLAAAILATSLCACAETAETATATEAATGQETVPASDVSESEAATTPECSLPELDFGGKEIVILSRYLEGWTSGEIAVEGLLQEPVNDAVYERNQIVEKQLNIKINSLEISCEDASEITTRVATSISGGVHEYDIVAAACNQALNSSLSGTFRDLRKSEYLDFEKPWWSQGFNEAVECRGMQFMVTGSAVLSMYRFAFATLFNKNLFDDAKVDYLYDTVRNGKWTLDYQNSLVEIFYRDNGNGVQDESGDIYGFVSNDHISVDPYWSSCNVHVLERDENGDYTIENFDAQKLQDVADKVLELFYGHGNATYDYKQKSYDAEQNDIRNMFAGGYAAMATLRIMALESSVMRDMKDEYGVVPMPKYDEQQEDYGTLLHNQFTVLCIPKTALDDKRDMMSAVMEALCYTSYNVVRPAYYNVALRSKLVSDPDSAEMLDLLFDSIYIDPGVIFTSALSSFHNDFRGLIASKSNRVMSTYKAKARSAKTLLKKNIVSKLQKLYNSGNA